MSLYPPETLFFINTWTWGYEDILKAVARAFGSKVNSFVSINLSRVDIFLSTKIHVDRYKYEIYCRLSDPFLKSILTTDAASTRFHACERFNRCEHVDVGRFSQAGKSIPTVVYVNPVDMGTTSWDLYVSETLGSMEQGVLPPNLVGSLSYAQYPRLTACSTARRTSTSFHTSRTTSSRKTISSQERRTQLSIPTASRHGLGRYGCHVRRLPGAGWERTSGERSSGLGRKTNRWTSDGKYESKARRPHVAPGCWVGIPRW